jgi:DNA-directed RNA polymerase specialized sigma24 family protein
VELLQREARELLRWRYGEGVRVQVIAERLARSPSAISVQLFGLRKILRECVSRKMGQPQTAASESSYGTA